MADEVAIALLMTIDRGVAFSAPAGVDLAAELAPLAPDVVARRLPRPPGDPEDPPGRRLGRTPVVDHHVGPAVPAVGPGAPVVAGGWAEVLGDDAALVHPLGEIPTFAPAADGTWTPSP